MHLRTSAKGGALAPELFGDALRPAEHLGLRLGRVRDVGGMKYSLVEEPACIVVMQGTHEIKKLLCKMTIFAAAFGRAHLMMWAGMGPQVKTKLGHSTYP